MLGLLPRARESPCVRPADLGFTSQDAPMPLVGFPLSGGSACARERERSALHWSGVPILGLAALPARPNLGIVRLTPALAAIVDRFICCQRSWLLAMSLCQAPRPLSPFLDSNSGSGCALEWPRPVTSTFVLDRVGPALITYMPVGY